MLGFMDWSAVVMGCALVLGGLGLLRWEAAKIRKGESLFHPGMRLPGVWLPVLIGLEILIAKVPHLLGVSHPIEMIMDALNVVLSIMVLFFALWWRRRFRARSLRTLPGPSDANQG
jgi:hypothetical protein